jgi:hypothetical protein
MSKLISNIKQNHFLKEIKMETEIRFSIKDEIFKHVDNSPRKIVLRISASEKQRNTSSVSKSAEMSVQTELELFSFH